MEEIDKIQRDIRNMNKSDLCINMGNIWPCMNTYEVFSRLIHF